MHFQLWVPGASNNARRVLGDLGLPDFADGVRECVVKYGDRSGLMLGWSGDIGIYPDRQKWIDIELQHMRVYLVLWTDDVCRPEDLARRQLFPGFRISLGGHDWVVPTAAKLPSDLRIIDRRWTSVRKPQFDEFWQRSEEWYRRHVLFDFNPDLMQPDAGESAESFMGRWADFCVFALRQNYRVFPELVSELGLLDTTNLMSITWAVVDGMNIKAVLDELSRLADVETGLKKSDESAIPE